MKKWLLTAGIILLLFSLATYFLIPSQLISTKTITIEVPVIVAFRSIAEQDKWSSWWPGKSPVYDGATYSLKTPLFNAVETSIERNGMQVNSTMNMVRTKINATLVQWEYTMQTSLNPVKRIQAYRQFSAITDNGVVLLDTLKRFLEIPENIYGMRIVQSSTIDTLLVSAKKMFAAPPGMEQVYAMVDQLKAYIQQKKAVQTGSPMLNITPADAGTFRTMVAIPTDKILPDEGNISFKRMFPGNFLVTEARGGPSTIAHAINQLQLYTDDYKRTVMAIPFQIMVTDRIKEKDTLQWITKLYMPVE